VVQIAHVISWRYHVVSIVAVVLAFGLGILAGTSVVNDQFVRELQRNFDDAQRQRNEALAQVAIYERLVEELQPTLLDDVLVGREAIVLTTEGVDRPAVRAVDELTATGVDVLTTISITRRLAESDRPEDVSTLQQVLGTTAADPESLRARAAQELADRLYVGADPDADDVLAALLAEGFVTADRDLDHPALQALGGVQQTIVLAAGGAPPTDLPGPGTFLVPVAERLVQLEAPVAVVGPQDDAYGLVGAVREASSIPDCSVVTVDDMDLALGGIALVMGLDRLLDDPDPTFRPGGDYGIDGQALVPGAEPPGSCRR
jgi:hypothetical protein